jgi:hypothetical protein
VLASALGLLPAIIAVQKSERRVSYQPGLAPDA